MLSQSLAGGFSQFDDILAVRTFTVCKWHPVVLERIEVHADHEASLLNILQPSASPCRRHIARSIERTEVWPLQRGIEHSGDVPEDSHERLPAVIVPNRGRHGAPRSNNTAHLRDRLRSIRNKMQNQ